MKSPDLLENCSMLVGMHPDEATDAIIDFAIQTQKPFAILPCCLCLDKFPERRLRDDGREVKTFDEFVRFLMEKHPGNRQVKMSYLGPNLVIYNPMAVPEV